MVAAVLATFAMLGFTTQRAPLRASSSGRGGAGVSMKPTPRVPYKYPGYETPVWMDIYNRMYRERILFLSQPINDNFANQMISVLLYLESEDATSPVAMYFNCYGGLQKSGLAIYDTMSIMPYDMQTVNMGIAADVAAFLVAGGTKGKRYALPNARFCLTNPRLVPPYDEDGNPIMRPMQATEMQLEVEEVLRDKQRMLEGYARFTGRSMDRLKADFGRDFYLPASDAKEYGLIDNLLQSKAAPKSGIEISATAGLG